MPSSSSNSLLVKKLKLAPEILPIHATKEINNNYLALEREESPAEMWSVLEMSHWHGHESLQSERCGGNLHPDAPAPCSIVNYSIIANRNGYEKEEKERRRWREVPRLGDAGLFSSSG